MKIYGPYTRKIDGRKHIIKYDKGKQITQSYPRYLMERHLGRVLLPTEHVDHVDEDFTNDDISNLQILTLQENSSKSMSQYHRQTKMFNGKCPECSKDFERPLKDVKRNLNKGMAGPYCSKSCAGKASARKQYA